MYGAIITIITVIALTGCSLYNDATHFIVKSVTPHRMKVIQGNFISQDKISQLHVGMTKKEVQALLCTPILSDIFNIDYWNYLFYFNCSSTQIVKKRDLVITFSEDHLIKFIVTDNIPSDFDPL
ncbi:MAG: outer membrane protein assembly factor BamE [Burkholderia sp.]|nr:outer membrane protein assembly factor BamE [Burkholderia sp.]